MIVDADRFHKAIFKKYWKLLQTLQKTKKDSLNEIYPASTSKGLSIEIIIKRWLEYRDNRNTTSHDYGVALAEKTLPLLPQFILDARALSQVIKKQQEKNL